jgi:hypothetical protein
MLAGPDYEDFKRLRQDMWFGNGKPGVTSRLNTLEGDVVNLKEAQADANKKFWAIIILLIASIVGAATDMITHRESNERQQHSSVY